MDTERKEDLHHIARHLVTIKNVEININHRLNHI